MEKSEKNNVPKYLFGAFCFYLSYFMCIILYLGMDKRWLIVPLVCIALSCLILKVHRDQVEIQAYALTIFSFINIFVYSMMLHEFTEVFLVICVAVCLASFYHFLKVNYLMVGLSTVFIGYKLIFQDEWVHSSTKTGSVAILIRILCVYLVQFLLIMLIKRQQRTQIMVEQKAREAEAAAQAKEDFLANMSHEIRTPMNAITGMVELALRNDTLPDQEKEYLYNIRAAGDDLVSIIEDILDVTKIRSGTLEIIEEEYAITSLVHDVVNVVQVMLEDKQVVLLVDVNPNIPSRLRGDDVRIKQVMMNLLRNATKYTEKGTIRLAVDFTPVNGEDKEIDLQVSVTDTGIGIAKEQLKDLFTKFKQADSSRNRAKGGSGLGLVISKKLIDLMRGTILAKSEVGKGSEFMFTVKQRVIDARPCIETAPQLLVFQPSFKQEDRAVTRVHRRKQEERNTTFTAPGAKILLVDDNKVNLKVAEGLLRPYKMKIEMADSGRQAIDMVQNQAYDLIFMDHMMPQMDGVEATEIIRALDDEHCRTMPIVALSANAVRGARELFLEAGMNDFVPKPIEMRVMDRVLRKWLPKDKVISNRDMDEETDKEETVGVEASALSWQMEGIDVSVGMKYSGNDEDLYREVLSDYMDTIEEKANVIEKAVEEGDLETYTIEVHSLKSTSKSIGAMELSELAKDLESNGKNSEWGPIIARTPALLTMYRNLYQVILPYHTKIEQETEQKQPIRNDELMGLLDQFLDSIDTYDSIRGEEIIAELSKFDFTDSWGDYMKEVADAMNRFDYDACKEKAGKWRSELEEKMQEAAVN